MIEGGSGELCCVCLGKQAGVIKHSSFTLYSFVGPTNSVFSFLSHSLFLSIYLFIYLSYLEKVFKKTATRISDYGASFCVVFPFRFESVLAFLKFCVEVGNQLPGCRLFSRYAILYTYI